LENRDRVVSRGVASWELGCVLVVSIAVVVSVAESRFEKLFSFNLGTGLDSVAVMSPVLFPENVGVSS
jgi:hypothetical protein